MRPSSRKRRNDSAEASPVETKKSKLSSTSFAQPKQKKDDDGNPYWQISDKRRLTISSFKNQTFVNLREFYEKDGKVLPGKGGIALKVEQFNALVTALPQISEQLRKKGFEVPVVKVEETRNSQEEDREEEGGGEHKGGKEDEDEESEA